MDAKVDDPKGALTFTRFEDGERTYDDLTDKIFSADTSYKCPTYIHRTPPCQGSCPSGHDIRGWLAIARGQDKPADDRPWQAYAFERMAKANPFPAIMGRVCPAPCEDGCNRNEVEDFVGINAVEQYVGDWAIENGLSIAGPEGESGKKVAVIGGGPAGLSAAYFLRLKGHGVTIFESFETLGGMMRFGIPDYRIPPQVLDAEIKRILDMGVEARTNTKVGVDVSMEDIEKEFDAVFWGIGAQNGRHIDIPGADAPNVVSGVAFLKAFAEGRLQYTTRRMVVIGGGDTSIDVASVARRIGHIKTSHKHDHVENVVWGHTAHDVASSGRRDGTEVILTSLFPVEGMMAAEREREDALSEGVNIMGSVMPVEVVVDEETGRAKAIRMCQCDMEGTVPVPRKGTEFLIWCDLVVLAIGQYGDLEGMESLDNGRGFIDTDKTYQVSDREGHFVGGDIIRPHLLTTAVGHGSIAAESIDAYLSTGHVPNRPKVDKHHFSLLEELHQRTLDPEPFTGGNVHGTSEGKFAVHNYEDRSFAEIVKHHELFLGHFAESPRNVRAETRIDADAVLGNYDERITGFTEEQAVAEGERCMSCGMCFECDNCLIFCPQDAVERYRPKERAVGRYVFTEYSKCVGCHVCKDVCPTGYIQMGLGE